jgi:hypothetical protein
MKTRKAYGAAIALGVLAVTCAAWGAGIKGRWEKPAFVGRTGTVTIDKAAVAVTDVAGGGISADVIIEPASPSHVVKKHLGQPKYENLSFSVAPAMPKPLLDWIASSWLMQATRKNITVAAPGRNLQLTQNLLVAVTVPVLDRATREQPKLRVVVAPEIVRENPPAAAFAEPKEPALNFSAFRVRIAGIPDVNCDAITRIEAFTVKQTTVTDDVGDAREATKEPGKLEFPNLVITVPTTSAAPFKQWHDDFVVKGNNDDPKERSGSIELLGLEGKPVLTIRFTNAGIFGLTPRDSVYVAELYAEQMTIAGPATK